MNDKNLTLNVFAVGSEFVMPYIRRQMPSVVVREVRDVALADVAVVTPENEARYAFPSKTAVLVCPNIVGTGMTGLPMALARRIARGSYYHLPDNDARLSTIHAADVARAVELAVGSPGRYIVTDGADPTFHDFSEALAFRINHKRILTLSSKWVRWIISPSLRRLITSDAVVDGSAFAMKFNFQPTPVTDYLRTHIYDEESL